MVESSDGEEDAFSRESDEEEYNPPANLQKMSNEKIADQVMNLNPAKEGSDSEDMD